MSQVTDIARIRVFRNNSGLKRTRVGGKRKVEKHSKTVVTAVSTGNRKSEAKAGAEEWTEAETQLSRKCCDGGDWRN